MAFPFPMPAENFFAGLKIQSCEFDLTENVISSGFTEDGDGLTARLGARRWRASITLAPAYWDDADAIMARLSILREAGRSLFVHPLPSAFPRLDPKGQVLGSAQPTISGLPANPREMRLTGLPAGYVLSAGDGFSFAYGVNPVRYAFHRIVSMRTVASGTGTTPVFEVTPALRPGASIGTPVVLARPFFKAVIVPGSASSGTSQGGVTRGMGFDVIQTPR